MTRPTRRKARLALAIVAALAVLPATAAAAPPASDEYVLEIPGVRQSDSGPVATASGAAPGSGDGVQRGVVGERETPAAPLAALGDSLAAIPAAFAVGLLALVAILALTVVARRPIPHGTR